MSAAIVSNHYNQVIQAIKTFNKLHQQKFMLKSFVKQEIQQNTDSLIENLTKIKKFIHLSQQLSLNFYSILVFKKFNIIVRKSMPNCYLKMKLQLLKFYLQKVINSSTLATKQINKIQKMIDDNSLSNNCPKCNQYIKQQNAILKANLKILKTIIITNQSLQTPYQSILIQRSSAESFLLLIDLIISNLKCSDLATEVIIIQ